MTSRRYDAIIVGSGPNGLAAAITLAQQHLSVLVIEANETFGGGARSEELTLPGFVHDVCSSIHPLGVGSPFFRALPLLDYGLEWIFPPSELAHPFDDEPPALMDRSVEVTAQTLGKDGRAYCRLMQPFADAADDLIHDLLGPLRFPKHPASFVRFGLSAFQPATVLSRWRFRGQRARGFLAGLAAHSILPLEKLFTTSYGLVLGMLGHAIGWPLPRGGSQAIADALVQHLRSLGGELQAGWRVRSLEELPGSRLVLLDLNPGQLVRIAGDRLPARYRDRLLRFRHGPGVFKLDWALDGPVPWTYPDCLRAGTVHLGGSLESIAASERDAWEGRHSPHPFVLLSQQSLFDPTRAREGKQTLWGYCHVPNGSTVDMTDRIETQVERYAPGFRDRILARHVMSPRELEARNANLVGGDVGGGAGDLTQLFTRPVARLDPYSTPIAGLYLCSASTPPGGGVHGLCGMFAARSALRYLERGLGNSG